MRSTLRPLDVDEWRAALSGDALAFAEWLSTTDTQWKLQRRSTASSTFVFTVYAVPTCIDLVPSNLEYTSKMIVTICSDGEHLSEPELFKTRLPREEASPLRALFAYWARERSMSFCALSYLLYSIHGDTPSRLGEAISLLTDGQPSEWVRAYVTSAAAE